MQEAAATEVAAGHAGPEAWARGPLSSAATPPLRVSVPLRQGPWVGVAVSTWLGLPSHLCPPGVASEPRGLGPQFPELLNSKNLVSTPLPPLNLDAVDQSIPKHPSSELLSADKLLGCQPACSLLFCS